MTETTISICLLKVPVSDLDASVAFYTNLFGIEPDFAVTEYGWAQFTVGALPFCLYQEGKGGGRGQAGSSDAIHFAVPDVAAAFARLTGAGLAVPGGVETSASGGAFFDVEDPDGNLFKFVAG